MKQNTVVKTSLFLILAGTTFWGSLVWGAAESGVSVTIPSIPDSSHIRIQPIEDREPPTTPSGVSAKAGQVVEIKWNPSTDQVTGLIGYRVYRDGEKVAQVEGDSFKDTGVSAGETHRYQVSALDGVGNESALSTPVTVRAVDPPAGISEAYCYPNPAVGGAVPVVRVEGSGMETLEVKIFDTSGHLLEKGTMVPRGPVGGDKTAYEYEWTGPISSGIYFGLVQGKSGDSSVRSHLKIAVIR
jgi:chitodextrinase